MSRKRGNGALGPGGKVLLGGGGALIVLFLVWQFVLNPFFFARSEPDAASPQAQSGNSSNTQAKNTTVAKPELVGQILDAENGLPIATALIKQGDGKELAKADADGKFTIAKLPADKNKLMIAAPGYSALPLPTSAEAAKAIQLKPTVLTGQLVDSESQKPIANRLVVTNDRGGAITDDAGKFTFSKVSDQTKVTVQLIGYEKVEQTVDLNKLDNLVLSVRSTSFSGSLTDAKTGKPIPNAVVKTDDIGVISGQDGKFTFNDLKRDDNTMLKVRAPGYRVQSFKATDLAKGVKMEPFMLHSVYVPGVFAIRANYDDLFTPYLQMAQRGEINAIVLGMKDDDDGMLWWDSQVPLAKEAGLVKKKGVAKDVLMDIPKILAEAKKRNLYVVARFVVMRDPAIAKAKPEWAIKNNKTGGPWQDDNKLNWPNPFVPEVADYNAALAKELATAGFDEIQYDYIRFPTDGKLKEIQYKSDLSWTQLSENEKLRTDTIEAVVKKAYDVLRPSDTFLSLDVFGMSLWREDDNNIGQQYNNLVMLSDYICPMVYPTHFEQGTLDQKTYPGPTGLYPAVIMEKSGIIASKLEAQLKPIAKYRPWLEDFGLGSVKHTPERVRLQIQAAEDKGAWGWTLWNAAGKYSNTILAARAKANSTP